MATDIVPEQRLGELEPLIDDGLCTFVEVGEALAEIKENDLWLHAKLKSGEPPLSFEEYVLHRFGITIRHANRSIAAAATVIELGPIGPEVIRNEAQAREAAAILKARGRRAAIGVLRRVQADGVVTAQTIRAARLSIAPSQRRPKPKPTSRAAPPRQAERDAQVLAILTERAGTTAEIAAYIEDLYSLSRREVKLALRALERAGMAAREDGVWAVTTTVRDAFNFGFLHGRDARFS